MDQTPTTPTATPIDPPTTQPSLGEPVIQAPPSTPPKKHHPFIKVCVIVVLIIAVMGVPIAMSNRGNTNSVTDNCNYLRSHMYDAAHALGRDYTNTYVDYSCSGQTFESSPSYTGSIRLISKSDLRSQDAIESELNSKLKALEGNNVTFTVTVSRLQVVEVSIGTDLKNHRVDDYSSTASLISKQAGSLDLLHTDDPSYQSYSFGYVPDRYTVNDNDRPYQDGVTSELLATFVGGAKESLTVIRTAGDMSSSVFKGSTCLTPPISKNCVSVGNLASGEPIYSVQGTDDDSKTTYYTAKLGTDYLILDNRDAEATDGVISSSEVPQILSNIKPR